ncbi:hypothetical protein [Paenibacillus sp. FSL L8-0708]|uniref:hypothetical protein n=1 Tax=Paenibacillus sp. FSL L8-0708 TaxID=2975311 RepID=UPI0030F67144
MESKVLTIGDEVKVTAGKHSGLTGITEDVGIFPCMGGAYSLTGVKVQLSGFAGSVILQESNIERISPIVSHADDWFFAELDVI